MDVNYKIRKETMKEKKKKRSIEEEKGKTRRTQLGKEARRRKVQGRSG